MDDREWLRAAIELSRLSPPTMDAYRVGAVIVGQDGARIARGYSCESDPKVHAEEAALAKALAKTAPNLNGATIYSSLEPCSSRRSRPRTCAQLIIESGIRRVVFALREPPIFVWCHGVELLEQAGVEVVQLEDLAPLVRDINAPVLQGWPGAGTSDGR
jgi:diaminohydroxyphosphoribosylaminopyrimidine deaminase / 5-amino-6-(5-phosphoribosylamino)uracil reductase